MPCATCGAATRVIESDGGITEGSFTEHLECANGHTGTVRGDAGSPPRTWDRSGSVFDALGVVND